MSEDKIAEIRARHSKRSKINKLGCYQLDGFTFMGSLSKSQEDVATLLAEVERLRAEIERLRAERDALRDAAREYLTTLGGAMKAGKFQMGGSAEMAHFVRQAMQKLDGLVFDREGPRPAGLEKLHEPLKRPS